MRTATNTFVDFLGDFPLPLFSGDVPGAELAQALASGMAHRGVEVLEIGSKGPDLGHYVTCLYNGRRFRICVTVRQWGAVGRWQLTTSAVTKRGRHRGLWRRADHVALAQLRLKINETLHATDAIWDIRWFPRPERPDLLELRKPGDGPVRDPKADTELPFIFRLEHYSRVYALILCIEYYFLLVGLAAFVNETDLAFPALIAYGTVLLCGIALPLFLSAPVSDLAQLRREERESRLGRLPKYPWRPVTLPPKTNSQPQFSLRTLLMVVAVTSAVLGVGCWVKWWRFLAITQVGVLFILSEVTFAPVWFALPGNGFPGRKLVGAWVLTLGALFVLHILTTVLVVERLLRTPFLLDVTPYDRCMAHTLNWIVPHVGVGLLIAAIFWREVRSSRACMTGCCLAAVGLTGALVYGHRFFCHYLRYDLAELSEVVWWA